MFASIMQKLKLFVHDSARSRTNRAILASRQCCNVPNQLFQSPLLFCVIMDSNWLTSIAELHLQRWIVQRSS